MRVDEHNEHTGQISEERLKEAQRYIGAIISPPVLGAAAFLIAEILKVSYLRVIKMAMVPTILYYWSIFLMVEFDAKRFDAKRFGAKRIEASRNFCFISSPDTRNRLQR